MISDESILKVYCQTERNIYIYTLCIYIYTVYMHMLYIYTPSSSSSHDHPTELPRSWPRSPSRTAPPRALSPTPRQPRPLRPSRALWRRWPAMAAMACFWKQEMVDWIIRNGEFPLDFPIRNDDEMLIEAAEIVNSPATNCFLELYHWLSRLDPESNSHVFGVNHSIQPYSVRLSECSKPPLVDDWMG